MEEENSEIELKNRTVLTEKEVQETKDYFINWYSKSHEEER